MIILKGTIGRIPFIETSLENSMNIHMGLKLFFLAGAALLTLSLGLFVRMIVSYCKMSKAERKVSGVIQSEQEG